MLDALRLLVMFSSPVEASVDMLRGCHCSFVKPASSALCHIMFLPIHQPSPTSVKPFVIFLFQIPGVSHQVLLNAK